MNKLFTILFYIVAIGINLYVGIIQESLWNMFFAGATLACFMFVIWIWVSKD